MERKLIEIYHQLHESGAFFFERRFDTSSEDKKTAVIKLGDDYAIFMDTGKVKTIEEETELVAHECGHVATGTTHSVCNPVDLVEKHEYVANKWAVHRVLPKEEIIKALRDGCVEPWEVAEKLDRTVQFVYTALKIYRAEGVDFAIEASEEFPVDLYGMVV